VLEWIDRLRASGTEHDETVAGLRALLLRAARHEVHRRRSVLDVHGPELDDIAHQAANDALISIIARVDDFRGESLFTTWAYTFVMFEVSTKIGRHFWRTRSTNLDDVDWERLADRFALAPQQRAEQRELFAALRQAIEASANASARCSSRLP